VIPRFHLVRCGGARDTQARTGSGGYRGSDTIEQAYRWAQSRQGLLFVDIQMRAQQTLQARSCRRLADYLIRAGADVLSGSTQSFYMPLQTRGDPFSGAPSWADDVDAT